jgi:hypothetical protein
MDMKTIRPVYDRNDQAAITDPSLLHARVPPAELEEYRRCHKFVTPCCLCAFIDGVALTESRIGVVGEAGEGSMGQYMAECARKRCGYSGEYLGYVFTCPLIEGSNGNSVPGGLLPHLRLASQEVPLSM